MYPMTKYDNIGIKAVFVITRGRKNVTSEIIPSGIFDLISPSSNKVYVFLYFDIVVPDDRCINWC